MFTCVRCGFSYVVAGYLGSAYIPTSKEKKALVEKKAVLVSACTYSNCEKCGGALKESN